MADVLGKQLQLKRALDHALENMKKLGRSNLTPAKIRSRLTMLKANWQQFLDGHALLLKGTPDDKRSDMEYFRSEFFEATEEMYEQTHDAMSEMLEALEPFVSLNASHDTSQLRASSSKFSLSHLPPIPMPTFDGRTTEWEQFRDRFHTLIINNADLNDFARMHFLSSCLTGPALDCIKSLAITGDNFEIAWETLTARFENKRRILSQHFATLLNLKVPPRESASDLQHLLDELNIAVASLRSLGRGPGDLWNDMLVHVVSHKLDSSTRKAWNLKTSDTHDLPSFESLVHFVASRARALEECAGDPSDKATAKLSSPRRVHVATASAASKVVCEICKAAHYFRECPTFMRANPTQRRELVRQHRRCFNCLSKQHSVRECKSRHSCRVCNKNHHSSLHLSTDSNVNASTTSTPHITESDHRITSLHASASADAPDQILLATVRLTVREPCGRSAEVRAMLDSGSQATFITENLAQILHARRKRLPISVSALGGVDAVQSGTALYSARVIVSPRRSPNPSHSVTAVILPRLTEYAPKSIACLSHFGHLANLSLADPDPTASDPIHMIIGNDLYNDILLDGRRRGKPHEPTAQNSIFGWVISGPIRSEMNQHGSNPQSRSGETSAFSLTAHHSVISASLDAALRRFWEIEELPRSVVLSADEDQCEQHFKKTHSRAPDGRYIVRLPFKNGPPITIGEFRVRAEKQLNSLSRRLHAHPEQSAEYFAFLSEYERLGHMRRVPVAPRSDDQVVFIPHHPVLRADSLTSHLRVVFNASSLTTNGTSLNDHLLCGAKLQSELPDVIQQWRKHRYVYVADIAKMYRQVLVDEGDVQYQRILWKPKGSDSIVEYELKTVTYGMACAPFLALRVLKQLAADEGSSFPLAVRVLRESIYVDDVLFGDEDLGQLIETRAQLVTLLQRGGFELRKWASNSPRLLAEISEADHGLACTKLLSVDEHLKVLGIAWMPSLDVFRVTVSLTEPMPVTKRGILSVIARLYDPLGWLVPVVVAAKILMQQLWREGVPVPNAVLSRWTALYSSLPRLNDIQIRRWIGLSSHTYHTELHGFADASNQAYAAVVYLKVISRSGDVSISLLAGKSKVAPIKALTVPRLELSGAVLLARLIGVVRKSLGSDSTTCFCWTDSSVVLAWLRQHPSKWKPFVSNRVAEVQSRSPNVQWRHVPTIDNPADCASRGLLANELTNHHLWWKGPAWLSQSSDHWPESLICPSSGDTPEERRNVQCVHVSHTQEAFELASRFSSWPKLLRVTAYLFRFINRCRPRNRAFPATGSSESALVPNEFQSAKVFWIRHIQSALFLSDITALKNHQTVATSSSILALNPFLDPEGILRVGGRIRRAPLPFPARHPILLASHPLVNLIIENMHLRLLHAGLQLTLSAIRHELWIIRARSVVRTTIRRCVVCTRERAETPSQIMGDLPAVRITAPSRAFLHCGVDYAGPVHVRASAGRGITSRKAYISLFICLATKAIHLELVSDYSTSAFRGAFARFCARRGLPRSMYSDNGTTFVGADRELTRAYRAALRDPDFLNRTAIDQIEWHFIPPAAPHFGGIWEAGVRSVKHHVRRVLGNHTLTFEEFSTLLCEVEACLNSRPIAPLTDALDDYEPLTPGHFLIGAALTAIPEPSLLTLNENRLTRWQLVRQLSEAFWKRWYHDYVNTLQQRSKWRLRRSPITIGQIVLVRNATLPPCKWELGRVIKCHSGDDGVTRVVTVKTASSEYKRPIGKLCILPVDSDVDS